ncbi:MAG: phytoene/squalene synthase family protein [Acidobacteriota bacterium]
MTSVPGNSMAVGAAGSMACMRRHGSTFSWAGGLLPADRRRDISHLYSFCRTVDDWVDNASDPASRQIAAERLAMLRQDLTCGAGRLALGAQLLNLAACYRFRVAPALALIDGVAQDLEPQQGFARLSELLRYAYRVAGTVGEMTCSILGGDDPAAVPFAIDLGIAMQLTNIARDVLEDAERGRLYLPRELLPSPATPGTLVAGDDPARESAWSGVRSLLEVAERYYRSADLGVALLPWRSRPTVMVASRVYEAIGLEVLDGGSRRYWQGRARVGRAGRLWHTARALGALGSYGSLRQVRRRHEASLHAALVGLSGALQ